MGKFKLDATDDRSLNQILSDLGYTTRRADGLYRKDILKDGAVVMTGTAGDVWAWLRTTKQC